MRVGLGGNGAPINLCRLSGALEEDVYDRLDGAKRKSFPQRDVSRPSASGLESVSGVTAKADADDSFRVRIDTLSYNQAVAGRRPQRTYP